MLRRAQNVSIHLMWLGRRLLVTGGAWHHPTDTLELCCFCLGVLGRREAYDGWGPQRRFQKR